MTQLVILSLFNGLIIGAFGGTTRRATRKFFFESSTSPCSLLPVGAGSRSVGGLKATGYGDVAVAMRSSLRSAVSLHRMCRSTSP